MNAKHTPSPWTLNMARTMANIKGPKGQQIAQVRVGMYGPTMNEPELNAFRIVACVNACAEIEATTEALQSGLIGELNKQASTVPLLTAQRDALLAACRHYERERNSLASNATSRAELDAIMCAAIALAAPVK